MRATITRALATVALALAACNDPTFDVHVHLASVPNANAAERDHNDLADKGTEITVKIIDAVAAGAGFLPPREANCVDLAFGYIDAAVIEGATRASGSGGSLTGVPRLGTKLVLVEARNKNGKRMGAGCKSEGDVSSDASVDVDVVPAPTVQVFGRQDTPMPVPVSLLLTAAWDEALPIPDHLVRTELHTVTEVFHEGEGEIIVDRRSNGTGVVTTPMLPPADDQERMPSGPAQTLVRVAWADEVIRLPAFVPWGSVSTNLPGGARITLPLSPVERTWVIANDAKMVNGRARLAATAPTQGAENVVLLYLDGSTGRLDVQNQVVAGGRAIALSGGMAYTILGDGWHRLQANGLVAQPWATDGTGVATEIHTIRDCAGERGLLVRRSEGIYVAYERVGGFPDEMMVKATGGLADLAQTIQPNGETVVASGCVTVDTAGTTANRREGVVLTRAPDFSLRARLVDDGVEVALPSVVGVATFDIPADPPAPARGLAAGVEVTIRGPRVVSYKLAELPPFGGGDNMTSFVPVDFVESELATVPSSFDVADIDGDGLYDVVAAVPTQVGPRLQVNLGKMVNGEQLAAVTGNLPGGRQANDAVVRFLDIDGDKTLELLMLSSEGADVFCFPGGLARCVVEP